MYKQNQVLDTLDVITHTTALKSSITSIERFKGGQQKVSSLLFYNIAPKLVKDDLKRIGIELETLSASYPIVILNSLVMAKYIARPTIGIMAKSIQDVGVDKLLDFRNYKVYLDDIQGIEALTERRNVCISTLIVSYKPKEYSLADLNYTVLQIVRALGNNQLQHLVLVVGADCLYSGLLKKFENIFKVKITFIVSFSKSPESVLALNIQPYLSTSGYDLCALTESLDKYLSCCNQYFYQFEDFSYIFPVGITSEKPQYNVVYYNDLEVARAVANIENYFNIIDIIQ